MVCVGSGMKRGVEIEESPSPNRSQDAPSLLLTILPIPFSILSSIHFSIFSGALLGSSGFLAQGASPALLLFFHLVDLGLGGIDGL